MIRVPACGVFTIYSSNWELLVNTVGVGLVPGSVRKDSLSEFKGRTATVEYEDVSRLFRVRLRNKTRIPIFPRHLERWLPILFGSGFVFQKGNKSFLAGLPACGSHKTIYNTHRFSAKANPDGALSNHGVRALQRKCHRAKHTPQRIL